MNTVLTVHDIEKSQFGGDKRCFTFLGGKECHSFFGRNEDNEYFDRAIQKRITAYNMIPIGATIIPRHLVGLFIGWFIGGILEDSLIKVYGIGTRSGGISGYSCSVFWVPTPEEMVDITVDMSKVHGEFFTKNSDLIKGEAIQ